MARDPISRQLRHLSAIAVDPQLRHIIIWYVHFTKGLPPLGKILWSFCLEKIESRAIMDCEGFVVEFNRDFFVFCNLVGYMTEIKNAHCEPQIDFLLEIVVCRCVNAKDPCLSVQDNVFAKEKVL